MDNNWVFYIIQNKNYTYAGVSPTPIKRLRQHNSEIKGGAKYTTNNSNSWTPICIIDGFQTKSEAMRNQCKHRCKTRVKLMQHRSKTKATLMKKHM